jgi:hypothetical protein
MSYCYGCKDSIIDFNGSVANCRAEGTNTIRNRETDGITGNEYTGNLHSTNCEVAGGDRDWAGLFSDGECNFYARCVVLYNRCVIRNDPTCTQTQLQSALRCSADDRLEARPFSPEYWAGIDCSGFAQRAVQNGRNVASGMNITIPPPPSWIGSQQFFTENGRVFYLANPIDGEEKRRLHRNLRKGDLGRYNSHISIVYSERPNCSGLTCNYQIIHASGYDELCYRPAGGGSNRCQFNRKVIINIVNNELQSSTLINPIGFGRITLWQ